MKIRIFTLLCLLMTVCVSSSFAQKSYDVELEQGIVNFFEYDGAKSQPSGYIGQIPQAMLANGNLFLAFDGIIKNIGSQNATPLLKVTVYNTVDPDNPLYEETISGSTLSLGNSETLSLTNDKKFTLLSNMAVGEYTVKFEALIDGQSDEDTENNIKTSRFFITHNLYGRDAKVVNTSISPSDKGGASGDGIAIYHNFYQDMQMEGVGFFVDEKTQMGSTLTFTIQGLDEGQSPDAANASYTNLYTQIYDIDEESMLGVWNFITFTNPLPITPDATLGYRQIRILVLFNYDGKELHLGAESSDAVVNQANAVVMYLNDSFVSGDYDTPTVRLRTVNNSFDPVAFTPDGSSKVTNLNGEISIDYGYYAYINSAKLSNVTISPDPGNVLVTSNDSKITITHDALEEGTTYTVTIPNDVVGKDPVKRVWSFTTGEDDGGGDDGDDEISIPEGYHAEDYTWIYNYVNANSDKFGIGTGGDDLNFDAWFEAHAKDTATKPLFYWTQDGDKRIKSILWAGPIDEDDGETKIKGKLEGTLDVSGLTKLEMLSCRDNQIEELLLPTSLTTLYCWNNQLQTLDVAPLINLTQLSCGKNQLTELDVENLVNLIALSCESNQLTELKVDKLINLNNLMCYENDLEVLNVQNLTELTVLDCRKNKLKKLEVTNLTKLFSLICWNNEIAELNIEALEELETLYCSGNKLSELNITSTKLEYFQCHRNQIPFSKLPEVNATKNDYHSQRIIHPVDVHPDQTIDLSSMVIAGYITSVVFDGEEIAQLTTDNPTITIPSDWLGEVVLRMTNAGFPQSKEDNKYFTYTLDVTLASSVYHTITLDVAGGIELSGLTAGSHQMAEDDHLHLQFLTEDRTLGADDILFLVDGVETEFKVMGENNYFSYILNPIDADHTILIALKEYAVTLPEVEGVTYNVGAGVHSVAYGETFSFSMTLADGIDPADVHVFANGIEIQPDGLRSVVLTYTIDKVITSIVVVIEGAGETVGNTNIAEGKIRVAVESGKLVVESEKTVDVTVYSIQGKIVASLRALCGTGIISLEPGIYLVKADTEVYKVSISQR